MQAIVEAAESSAASIEREAREHAAQVEQDAAREAQRIRDEAIARSQDHVGKVHEATALMLQRVDAMESELGALVESLRTGANRLSADLSLLSGNMGELYGAARRAPTRRPGATSPRSRRRRWRRRSRSSSPSPTTRSPSRARPSPPPPTSPPPAADADDDVEGARLIALNMALNGQTREETDKYLAENFDLADRAALLDEVYATVEG